MATPQLESALTVGAHDDLVTALGLAGQEPARQLKITWSDEYDVVRAPTISKSYWRTGR